MRNLIQASSLALILALPSVLMAQTKSAPPASDASTEAEEPSKPEPKRAIRDPALYQAEVEYRAGNESRESAIGRALQAVMVKLTGSRDSRHSPVVRKAMSTASSLLDGETSVRQENDMANGVPVYRQMLTARFDPVALDTLIAAAGQRYWTGERPKPILWLSIDDGRGPRLVTAQQLSVVKPLANAGLERGMRFLLPAGNAVELNAIGSITALDGAALQPLTARYGNNAQLVGKVFRQNGGWAANWLLMRGGSTLSSWSHSDPSPHKVIASGAEGAADAVARADARALPYGAAGRHLFVADGVDSQGEFVRLMGYLQGMPIVRRIEVLSADSNSLRLMLDMSVGPRGFALLTQGNPVFVTNSGGEGDVDDARATRLRMK